jgi:hypothetical protein
MSPLVAAGQVDLLGAHLRERAVGCAREDQEVSMDGDAIFLRVAEDLAVMAETPYEKESILQQALAEHPEVIAGPTTTGGAGFVREREPATWDEILSHARALRRDAISS